MENLDKIVIVSADGTGQCGNVYDNNFDLRKDVMACFVELSREENIVRVITTGGMWVEDFKPKPNWATCKYNNLWAMEEIYTLTQFKIEGKFGRMGETLKETNGDH